VSNKHFGCAGILLGVALMISTGATADVLDVPADQTVRLTGGSYEYETVNILGTLLLQGDVTMTVTGPALPSGSVFYNFGEIRCDLVDGADGVNGVKGDDGADGADGQYHVGGSGSPGENGGDGAVSTAGQSGQRGQDGYNLTIIVHGKATIDFGAINLNGTDGGSGGWGPPGANGGRGGDGATGADEDAHGNYVSGNGGNGGDGGKGANGADAGSGGHGGNGGNLILTVYGDLELYQGDNAGIWVNGGMGGSAGSLGDGGDGGSAGKGGNACLGQTGDGGNGNAAGIPGRPGDGGDGGQAGTVEIRVTGDLVSGASNGGSISARGGSPGSGSWAGGGGDGGHGNCAGDRTDLFITCTGTWGTLGSPSTCTDASAAGAAGAPGDGGSILIHVGGEIRASNPGYDALRLSVEGADAIESPAAGWPGMPGGCSGCDYEHCQQQEPFDGHAGPGGLPGGDAGTVTVRAVVAIQDPVVVDAQGGNGGKGGHGGGYAFRNVGAYNVTDYSRPGPGGAGGRGGKGGTVTLEAPTINVVDEDIVVTGGLPGEGGDVYVASYVEPATPGSDGAAGDVGSITRNLTTPPPPDPTDPNEPTDPNHSIDPNDGSPTNPAAPSPLCATTAVALPALLGLAVAALRRRRP